MCFFFVFFLNILPQVTAEEVVMVDPEHPITRLKKKKHNLTFTKYITVVVDARISTCLIFLKSLPTQSCLSLVLS